jgi:hypothetical protein
MTGVGPAPVPVVAVAANVPVDDFRVDGDVTLQPASSKTMVASKTMAKDDHRLHEFRIL